MITRSTLNALCAGLLLALPLRVPGEDPALEPLPEPPPVPEAMSLEESLEPQVRIVRSGDKVITQYVVNGVVRAIRVEHPDSPLPPYYLIDTDGDGRLDRRSGFPDEEGLLIAHWVVLSW